MSIDLRGEKPPVTQVIANQLVSDAPVPVLLEFCSDRKPMAVAAVVEGQQGEQQ
jgi:hypothetical protein